MFSLFGKAIGATKGVANDMAGYLDDASDAVGGLGGGAGDAADGLGSAGKAAKELKKQLTVLPFDELNQLAKDTESASSGGGGGGGAGGGGGGIGGLGDLGIEDWGTGLNIDDSPVVQAINRWAARIREAFQKHQWANLGRIIAEGINSGFKYIYDILDWEKIKPKIVDGFITPFQTTFNSMMDWIDWDLIGATFARGLNVIVYTLRAWITGFHWRDYGGYLAEGMNSMINGIDADALGRLIADKFKTAWEFFGGWVRKFNFKSFGSKLKIMFTSALDELDFNDMGESLGLFITGIANTISEFLRDGDVQKKVTEALTDFANGFIKGFDGEDVRAALESLSDTIGGILGDTLRGIDKEGLAEDLKSVLEGLPWDTIFKGLGAIIGGKLAIQFFGTAFKNRASAILASQFPNLFGGGAGTTGGVSSVTTGASTLSGATGFSLGKVVAGTLAVTAITIGAIELGKYIKEHGWGQLDTEGNKQRAAQETSEGARKNQQALDKAGMNGAGYNTSIQTVPNQPAPQTSVPKDNAPKASKPTNTVNTVTTVMKGVTDGSFKNLQVGVNTLKKDPTITKYLAGQQTSSYKANQKDYNKWVSGTVTKTSDSKRTSAYNSNRSNYYSWISATVKKTATSAKTAAYKSIYGDWVKWTPQSVTKTTLGKKGTSYINVNGHWVKWDSEGITKTAFGEGKDNYWSLSSDYKGLKSKDITVGITIDIDTTLYTEAN